ncbi:MAG: hypothetical protein ACNA8P_10345 [Phycisphaerales bacterium]
MLLEAKAGCNTQRLRYIAGLLTEGAEIESSKLFAAMTRIRRGLTETGNLDKTGRATWELTNASSIISRRSRQYLEDLELAGVECTD